MPTVTLRLTDQTRDELEQLARGRNSTVSDVLREAIDGLLGRDVDAPRADVPRSLDMVQRRLLALQHEILARLDPDEDEKEAHRRSLRILSGGFTTEYPREFFSINAEIPPTECTLVMDILDMFVVLEAILDRLDDDALAEVGDHARVLLVFGGFDFQNPRESRLADFAEHLIADGRWSNLAHHFGDEHQCLNSHMPQLERYRRMLQTYSTIIARRAARDGCRGLDTNPMTVDDLKKIYAAARPTDA